MSKQKERIRTGCGTSKPYKPDIAEELVSRIFHKPCGEEVRDSFFALIPDRYKTEEAKVTEVVNAPPEYNITGKVVCLTCSRINDNVTDAIHNGWKLSQNYEAQQMRIGYYTGICWKCDREKRARNDK